METGYLLYRSTAQMPDEARGLRAILAEARPRNRRLNLTGYLHYEDGTFYQWIEGPPDPLADVAAMIERDPRHRDLRYLRQGRQTARRFEEWTMGFGASEPGTLFQWVADRGISPLDEATFARSVLDFLLSAPVRARAEAG